MAITPITRDEFPQSSNAEAQAVSGLKEGTGIKFPCRWKHGGKVNACALEGGVSMGKLAIMRGEYDNNYSNIGYVQGDWQG